MTDGAGLVAAIRDFIDTATCDAMAHERRCDFGGATLLRQVAHDLAEVLKAWQKGGKGG